MGVYKGTISKSIADLADKINDSVVTYSIYKTEHIDIRHRTSDRPAEKKAIIVNCPIHKEPMDVLKKTPNKYYCAYKDCTKVATLKSDEEIQEISKLKALDEIKRHNDFSFTFIPSQNRKSISKDGNIVDIHHLSLIATINPSIIKTIFPDLEDVVSTFLLIPVDVDFKMKIIE